MSFDIGRGNLKIFNKMFILFLAVCFILTQNSCTFALDGTNSDKMLFHGKVELNDKQKDDSKLFTGETKQLDKGTKLKMTVSQVLSSGYTEEGDEFFAEVSDDLTVPGGIVIPSGTIAHGKVTKLEGSRRLGRDGYINIKFDYLVTPDGREIPIEANMTTKRHPVTSVAKVALENTAITMAGGVIGGVAALKIFGIGGAVASQGYTLAGGAGVGALVGAGISLARKGKDVLVSPGDEINVQISGAIKVPVMTEEAFKDEEKSLDGLNIKITDYKVEKDPFGEPNTITLGIHVDNKTNKTFSTFDMALINDYKAVFYPSPFGDTELWFQKIDPNSRTSGKLSFSVDNTKRKHWLVFYDTSTRKPLAKVSIKNSIRRLKQEKNKNTH